MTSTLRGRGESGKHETLLDVGGEGLASVLDVQPLCFFLTKKIDLGHDPTSC